MPWVAASLAASLAAQGDDRKRRGFKFLGTTICYAFMQATGLVDDHLVTCPRHRACVKLGRH